MTQDIDVGKLSEQLNDKADRDLWNTVPNVWNNTLNTSQITNCITEIPQNIKLELKDGVLTLKAGSKVYVPNGKNTDGITKKFDMVVIENDVVFDFKMYGSNLNGMVVLTVSNELNFLSVDNITSGNTAPTIPYGARQVWFDTTTNIIKMYAPNATEYTECCLPLCLGTSIANTDFVLEQVFNGIGYVGSTMFMLPGIKGLAPDGLNEDGTLRNKELVTTEVSIWTVFFDATYGQSVFVSDGKATTAGNILTSNMIRDYIISETMPDSPTNYTMWYNPKTNIMQRYRDEWFQTSCFYIGNWFGSKTEPYQITKVPDLIPLSIVSNYSKSYVAEQSFPSDRHVDLTLGASGSTYTAPANGWFLIKKRAGSTSLSYIALSNLSTSMASEYPVSGNAQYQAKLYIPAKKHEQVNCTYTMTGTTDMFRFVYAEGEK